jgi:hypothetical protein
MPLTRPRYDGYAGWYDNWNKPHAERNAADVLDLLGPGAGLCLDLGCGSGRMRNAANAPLACRRPPFPPSSRIVGPAQHQQALAA